MRGSELWAIAVVSLLVGCARPPPEEPEPYAGQSFCEAMELMCEVDRRAGLTAEPDPIEKTQKREDYLTEHVKNPDAIYFRTLLKVKANHEKATALRAEAREAGIASCPLADTVAREEF